MQSQVKTIKERLAKSPSDNEKVDLLNNLASALIYSNHSEALENATEAQYVATKNSYKKGIAYAKLYKAISMFLLSKTEHVLENLLEALEYFKQNPEEKGYAIALNYTANLYKKYEEYELALGYCQQSIKVSKKYNHKETLGDAFGTHGKIYTKLTDYIKAIDSFSKSLEIRKELKNEEAIASSLNWIARTYSLNNEYKNALEYYHQSIELRKKTKAKALPWSYLGIAGLYKKMEKYELAIANYNSALELNGQKDENRCNLHCYKGLGEIYSELKDSQKSTDFLLKALKIAESLESKPILFEIHLSLAETYENLNDFQEALKHYRLYQSIHEEVLNSEMLNKLKYQQVYFEVEKARNKAEIFQLRNVELKQALEQIEKKNLEINDSIEYARNIQMALLPDIEHIRKVIPESFVLYKPRNVVSGDFYWIKKVNKYIILAAADCTGHGVPGALLSMLGISFINEIVQKREIIQANQVLNELRNMVKQALRQNGNTGAADDGMDMALAVIDTETNKLQFAGANNPIYIISKGELNEIEADKMPVSYYPNEKGSFTNHEIQLLKDDVVYMFSDGYVDQFGGKKGFKYRRTNFKNILIKNYWKPMSVQKELLEKELDSWMKGYEQTDDILVMGVRVC